MHVFLQNPAEALHALSRFFGHQPGPEEVVRMTAAEVPESNAKQQNQKYDKGVRQTEAQQVIRAYQHEIRQAMDWIHPLVRDPGLVEYMESLRLT